MCSMRSVRVCVCASAGGAFHLALRVGTTVEKFVRLMLFSLVLSLILYQLI